jgi:hypothetical protein
MSPEEQLKPVSKRNLPHPTSFREYYKGIEEGSSYGSTEYRFQHYGKKILSRVKVKEEDVSLNLI